MLTTVVPAGIPAPEIVAPTNKLVGLLGQEGGFVNVRMSLPLVVDADGLNDAVVCIEVSEAELFVKLKY
jgi:hypothetical protein